MHIYAYTQALTTLAEEMTALRSRVGALERGGGSHEHSASSTGTPFTAVAAQVTTSSVGGAGETLRPEQHAETAADGSTSRQPRHPPLPLQLLSQPPLSDTYNGPMAAPTARWLLVTDSVSLKASAQDSYSDRLRATTAVPAHVLCGNNDMKQRFSMLETLGELLLLAECDAIVHGRSRFPLSALYMGGACRQSVRVDVETERCAPCVSAALESERSKKMGHAKSTAGSEGHEGGRSQATGSVNKPMRMRTHVSHACTHLLRWPWNCRRSPGAVASATSSMANKRRLPNDVSFYSVAEELLANGDWRHDAAV